MKSLSYGDKPHLQYRRVCRIKFLCMVRSLKTIHTTIQICPYTHMREDSAISIHDIYCTYSIYTLADTYIHTTFIYIYILYIDIWITVPHILWILGFFQLEAKTLINKENFTGWTKVDSSLVVTTQFHRVESCRLKSS